MFSKHVYGLPSNCAQEEHALRARALRIGYTPRARLLSDLATKCHRHEVAKSLGNQA